MFGESESESPRVPSPWDSLISTPPPPPPSLPRLVPENDDGNVEYKLQLLSPSPTRFARLVTQLKWRLLEGGGQAYYELGVADSGALVGLPRLQLEQSLETLEMMAGEIGASVIVVKEIEVPAAMAGSWRRRPGSSSDSTSTCTTDDDGDGDGDGDYDAMASHVSIDLEIASVFKPRPMRARMHLHANANAKTKRLKKIKTDAPPTSLSPKLTHDPTPAETSALVSGLAALHVSLDDPFLSGPAEDVFAPPQPTNALPRAHPHESRLIVEALVVRKMSLDEAFLDFSGFMLT